jgi:hypothetical protein
LGAVREVGVDMKVKCEICGSNNAMFFRGRKINIPVCDECNKLVNEIGEVGRKSDLSDCEFDKQMVNVIDGLKNKLRLKKLERI